MEETKHWKIQHRWDTAKNWSDANPILEKGEYGIVSDSPKGKREYRVGDGVSHWNALPASYDWDGKLPKVPTTLAELAEDETHRTVTDAEKEKWNTPGQAVVVPTKLSELAPDLASQHFTQAEKDNLAALWEKANPLTLSAWATTGIFEKGTTNTIIVNWKVMVGATLVTPDKVTINGVEIDHTLNKNSYPGVTSNTQFDVTIVYKGKSLSDRVNVYFVNNSYYGAVESGFVANESNVKGLKNKILKNTKSLDEEFALNNQKVCYAYPKSLGDLTSVKDANGYEVISGYNKEVVTVNSEPYNVYIKATILTDSNYKQIFS